MWRPAPKFHWWTPLIKVALGIRSCMYFDHENRWVPAKNRHEIGVRCRWVTCEHSGVLVWRTDPDRNRVAPPSVALDSKLIRTLPFFFWPRGLCDLVFLSEKRLGRSLPLTPSFVASVSYRIVMENT